jgi:hypothetical protein
MTLHFRRLALFVFCYWTSIRESGGRSGSLLKKMTNRGESELVGMQRKGDLRTLRGCEKAMTRVRAKAAREFLECSDIEVLSCIEVQDAFRIIIAYQRINFLRL